MCYRMVGVSAVVLAITGAASAQMTPISGSRGISMSATGYTPYSNSAPFDVAMFDDSHSIGGGSVSGQASITSDLAPNRWFVTGSARADAMFAPPGSSASASSSVDLAFHVEAGTTLFVDYFCNGYRGGFNSSIRVTGGGLNIITSGGTNGSAGSQTVLVTQSSTVTVYAWGGGSGSPNQEARYGSYRVTINATAPAPASAGLLGLAAASALSRRRR